MRLKSRVQNEATIFFVVFSFYGMLLLIGRRLVYELTMMRNYNAINWITTSWKIVISMHDICICNPYLLLYTGTQLVCVMDFYWVCLRFSLCVDKWLSVFTFGEMSNWKCNNNLNQNGRHRLNKTHDTYLHARTHTSKQARKKKITLCEPTYGPNWTLYGLFSLPLCVSCVVCFYCMKL